tara:strand:- start:5556 stop:5810 length:255 start_codon:yes stop_codon:yes gene_type:complete
MRPKVNQAEKQRRVCARFNYLYPVGTLVKYWAGFKEGEPTGTAKTTSEAFMRSGRNAAIRLDGQGGYILLSHIEPVESKGFKPR